MSQAREGDTVRIHYTGRLTDGKVFGSSHQRDPLELTLGGGQIIPGVERAVKGMAPGESKRVAVPASDAFGERTEDKVVEFDRRRLPADVAPELGQQVKVQTEGGQEVPAVVTMISDSSVTVDANHPLAGLDLVFDLELVEIV